MIRGLFFLFLMNPFAIFAGILHLESGTQRNTLIELYTSEGCSSCPPAEKYLNKLKQNKNLWRTLVPVAFHVDYWDYLGWRDRYAHKVFGQRQSQYASLKKVPTVYTPAFIVNGESWRPGIFSRDINDNNQTAGNLIIDLENEAIHAKYKSHEKVNIPLNINVAIMGMELSSNIARGENAGRKAEHEFVVVGYDSMESQTAEWKIKLPVLHFNSAKKYALAVWVSTLNNPAPLQVVGSYILLKNK